MLAGDCAVYGCEEGIAEGDGVGACGDIDAVDSACVGISGENELV